MDIQEYLNNNNIKQIYISKGLYDNKNSTLLNIKYEEYQDYKHINEPVLFWGVYNLIDYKKILNHIGDKFIFWGGKDADISNKNKKKLMNNIRNLNIKEHLCCNNNTYNILINIFRNVRNIFKKTLPIKLLENPHMSDTKYINNDFLNDESQYYKYFDFIKYKKMINIDGYGHKYGDDIDKDLCWHHYTNCNNNDIFCYLSNEYFSKAVNNNLINEHLIKINKKNEDFTNKKILYIGQMGTTGFGNVILNNIYILNLLGFQISMETPRYLQCNFNDMNNIQEAIQIQCINKFDGNESDIIFYHDSIADFPSVRKKYPNKIIIAFCVWETDKLPDKWKFNLDNYADVVIFPSSYNYLNYKLKSKCYFIESFINYDKNIMNKNNSVLNTNINLINFSKYKIKFYFIGQWNFRKDIIRLINLYKEIFVDNTEVCLFIKTFHGCPSDYNLNDFESNNPKIIIDTTLYTKNEINILHQIGDCFINCSHNEGTGLSVINSSVTSDLISMNIGGHTDYIYNYIKLKNNKLNNIDISCIPYDTKYLHDYYLDYSTDLKWYYYDENELKYILYNYYLNKNYYENFIKNNEIYLNSKNNSILTKFEFMFNNIFDKSKIMLIQQYYDCGNDLRQQEIDNCLQLNLNNPNIDLIILLNEKEYNFTEYKNNNKIHQEIIIDRLAFKHIFDYANYYTNNDFIITANNDIEIPNDINKIRQYNFKNIIYCNSRYDDGSYLNANDGLYQWSQDVWIFKSKININSNNFNFNFGVPHCDNALIYNLNNENLITFNVAADLTFLHHHKSNYRFESLGIKTESVPMVNKTFIDYHHLPCFVLKQSNINKVLEIKENFNLNSIQTNFFIKMIDTLNIDHSNYENAIKFLLYNENSQFELDFIKDTSNKIDSYLSNYSNIDDINKILKLFIKDFSFYRNLYINKYNNIKDIYLFLNKIQTLLFVSRCIGYESQIFSQFNITDNIYDINLSPFFNNINHAMENYKINDVTKYAYNPFYVNCFSQISKLYKHINKIDNLSNNKCNFDIIQNKMAEIIEKTIL
jgi:hypothetical protein